MSLSKSLVSWSIGMLLLSFLVTSVLVYQLHMAQFESRWKEILYIDLSGVNYETQTQTLPSKTYSELKLSTSVSNEDFFKNYEFIKLLTNDQWLVRHLSANKITEYRLSELGFSANNFQFQFKRVNNQVYGLYKIPGALGLLPENKSVWIFAHRDISESYYDFIFETVLHVVITILVFLTFQIGHHIILRRQILVPMVNMIRNTDSLLLNNNLAETSKGTSEVLHLEVLFAELQRNLTKYRNNADKQRTINAAFAIAFPDKGLIVNSQGVIDIILGSRKSMVKRLNNDLIGTPYTSWLSLHLVPIIQQQYDEAILTNEMVIREIVEDHRSLESRMVPLVQNIIGENKPAFLWLIRDITEIRQKQKTIEYQANFDPLTDLANRRRAMKKIEEYVAVAQTQQQWSSILFIDLDHFKNINDSLGHHVGDHLLIDMSKRLRTVAQSNDVIARLGGDEFLILAGDFKNSEAEAIDYAVNLGDQVLKLISKPFAIGINRFHLSASIGVATFPTVNCDANDLIRQADTAMYHAKGLGRARLCVYNQRMHEATSNRLILFNDLYQAILDEAFTLVFQPQYNDDGAVTGAEVLCRWINNGQSVYPDLFIEAAEETNLIIPLGTWLLEKSCDMLCSWHQRGLLPSSFKRLAINISPAQFTDDEFENILNNTTARFAIDPSMIELELTERLFVKDKELIRDKMKRLNESGFTFALDDFGTGYSSLSYLQQLPINKLKIDRSFVMDIHDLEHDANIVDAIIQLSANLHMDIIAEGVENETQRCYLSSRGCHNYQGYLFSHPLREAQFIECINTPDIPFK